MTRASSQHGENIAVLFAGGVGSRMGHADGPKQFVEVEGKPIIVYTLDKFQEHDRVDRIYVSCIEEKIPDLQRLILEHGITKVRKIVAGGSSAHESIYNGISAAFDDERNNGSEIVLIHDAVRPVINGEVIDNCIDLARARGTAITSIPAFETVAESYNTDDTINHVANRDHMYILQAPQCFVLSEIHDVNRMAERDNLVGSFIDQAHMMKHYGRMLHLSKGLRGNVKITVPPDLRYFEYLVKTGEIERLE